MNAKKVLTNVWINQKENMLFCGDVYFNDKIIEIIPRDHKILDWVYLTGSRKKNKLYPRKGKSDFPSSIDVFDGKFNLLMPGAIDSHVHFNTPGFEDREDFEHGSLAAAFGGVTTVIDMPCTSLPPVTSLSHLQTKQNTLKNRSYIDYALWGGVRGNDFYSVSKKNIQKQINELAEAGVVGFKVYMISGMETFQDLTFEQIYQTAEWIKPIGLPMAVHAEKKHNIITKRQKFVTENKNGWQYYCEARNFVAEGEAVAEMMNVARMTQCSIHIVHLSTEFGLDIIEKAKASGIPISGETCPHYLYFTFDSFNDKKISAFLKTAPPVKQLHDKDALWRGIKDNILQFVTTDHAGCNPKKEKVSKNFWNVYGGIPGVEHRVPFLFSEGFLQRKLSIEHTIKLLSTNVAKYFGLTTKGTLDADKDADFSLINLWKKEKVTGKSMHCKGKYTPFEDVVLNVKVDDVYLKGKRIIKNRTKVFEKPGQGRFVPRIS